jgi:predicted Fe-S protein YdhL (DUF1289 family)
MIDDAIKQEIKARVSLVDIVRQDYPDQKFQRAGQNDFKCFCPFHAERDRSCHVDAKRLKCFGCGASHDLVSYWQATRNCNFREAIGQLAARVGITIPTAATDTRGATARTTPALPKPPPPPKRETEKPLPSDFDELHRRMRWSAYKEADAQADVASKLEIRAGTVRELTVPIACTLGWSREPIRIESADGKISYSRPRRVTYCYCHGIKVRAPYGDDRDPRFNWACGRPVHPWRGCIMVSHPKIERVILTESESDLCAGFDDGWEKLNPRPGETGRVLVAGATGFAAEWIPLFKNRRVLIAFDADEAGERGAQEVAGMLSPVATSVEILNLTAV